jgi:transposase
LYSIETRQPAAFTKQPGNIPDVITIENALKELSVLGMSNAETVTDNGYYSERNLSSLFLAGFAFITLAKVSLKWVSAEIDNHREELSNVSNACPFDMLTHGTTITSMRDFVKVRKYAGHKRGIQKGEEETFRRRVYLSIFFNPSRKVDDDLSFDSDLIDLKTSIERGTDVASLSENTRKKVEKYLHTARRGSLARVTINEAACSDAKKYHGYFALVSNCENDPFDCLRKYRKRETIESYFESMKQHADGARIRVWDTDTLRGRMFVQFVALCYYEYLSQEIHNMKSTLGIANGNPEHDTAKNLALEKKLKCWLDDSSIYLILQWFDTVEGVEVSTKLTRKRWSTEITLRDKMFLEKLGISLPY